MTDVTGDRGPTAPGAASATSAARPDGVPKVQGRVRVLLRPVGRGHGVGRHAALAAPVRPHPLGRHRRRRWRSPASTPCSPPTTCPGEPPTASSTPTSRCSRATSCATPASRSPRSPPTTPRPPGGRSRRSSSTTSCSTRSSTPRRPSTRRADPPRRQRVPPPRIRHGDADGRRATVVVEGTYEVGMQDQAFMGPECGAGHPRPTTAASSCTCRPSGCTSTATRSPRASASTRTRCGSPSPASAARSAPARTSACRCTSACSRCAPAGR